MLPGVVESVTETTTISYSYDPLYRVTGATYTGGLTNSYGYAYDAVGNRTVQTQTITSTLVITYTYDIANRLTNVNGQPYTWDGNGNLLDDGAQSYGYDQANRLKQVVQGAITTTFAYNGAGDRLQQTVNGSPTHYVLDPAAGLTQVLSDGTNTYLYGNARLGQYQASMQYFGADGLGSVRQMYDASGQVIGSTRYDPYGSLLSQSGATSVFAFAGEQQDATGLTYLRARYYSAAQGRFTTRDVWEGSDKSPLSLNRWNYVQGDPVNYADPSGYGSCLDLPTTRDVIDCFERELGQGIKSINGLPPTPKKLINDLLDVQFTGFLDTAGLEGDWLLLARIWFLNERPGSLGAWSTAENGDPLVTITSEGYINDLKKKQAYAIARNLFGNIHPDICSIRPGDSIKYQFRFTGLGTAGKEPFQDKYNALEWFLGSYDYSITAREIHLGQSQVRINVEVSNRSNWQSESRFPPSWIDLVLYEGLTIGGVTVIKPLVIPEYLIPDWVGGGGRPGAAFQQRFIWQDSLQYPWVPIPVDPGVPPEFSTA